MASGTHRAAFQHIPRVCLILLALLAPFGAFRPVTAVIDQFLGELRFSAFQRDASQQIAFIAIDKDSLEKIGVWPWPRGIYADILDSLSHFDPKDIFFDIDFSTPSSPQEDAKLAEALDRAGGGVILPIFKQHGKAGELSAVDLTKPIALFSDMAWPAFANVALDDAGLVSRFATSDDAEGLRIQTVATVLAGYEGPDGTFPIDYSIQPTTIPTFSVSDLLAGKIPASSLQGKTIVIGAYATELKDIYPVPVHGAISGPLIHILAAETILQDRLLGAVDQLPLDLFLVAAVIAAALAARRVPVLSGVAATGLAIVGMEAAALWLQQSGALILHTGESWTIVLLGLCLFISEKFDFNRFLLRRAMADRRLARTVLQQIIAESSDAVIVFDDRLTIVEASQSAAALWPRKRAEARRLDRTLPADLSSAVERMAENYRKEPGHSLAETIHFSTDEPPTRRYFEASLTISPRVVHLERGGTDQSSFIGSLIVRDRTAQRKYEQELLRLSQTDELTGLLNRREFAVRLGRESGPVIVAAVGFHRFEVVAKVLGTMLSDRLLPALADRLRSLPQALLLGRLGPDRFVIAIRDGHAGAAEALAGAVAELFKDPIDLGGSIIPVDVRIGLYRSQANDEPPASSLAYSEAALESACSVSSHWWREFDPALASRQERARRLEHEMRAGLQRGEFFLLYQPQVDLKTGAVVGAEALLRWNHPETGAVSPAEFIPVAEASGFIRDLGRFALVEACRAARQWPSPMSVAVNVSGVQIQAGGLLDDVRHALAESGLAPGRLHLEITESAFVEGSRAVLDLIAVLRDMGLSIALDDFGTGYSSLSYMTSMPLDKLKIDQSFIRRLAATPGNLVIIQSILSLSQGLRLKTVAEGIESQEEWDILRSLGCEEGQGYLFGRPMSTPDLLVCERMRAESPALRAG